MSSVIETSAPAAKGSRFWKIVALAFMVAVIGGECLVAFIYLSTAGQTSAQAEVPKPGAEEDSHGHGKKDDHGKHDKGHGDQGHGEKPKHDAHGKSDSHAKPDAHGKGHGHDAGHEAKDAHGDEEDEGDHGEHGGGGDHGEHEVDLGQYSLTVYQPASNSSLLVDFHLYGTISAEDEHDFHHIFDSSKHRIRDQVIVTVRSAEMTDFADPGLGLIKRQILEKSNATLGKRYLQAIVFSDFTLLEQ